MPVISGESGFTLFEILVVLMIVGIIAAASIEVFKPSFGTAKGTAAVTSIHTINNAILSYANMDQGNVTGVTINADTPGTVSTSSTTLVGSGVLGKNWANVCPENGDIAHCDPWDGYYHVSGLSSSVYYIALEDVPPTQAYQISSQLWNMTDNSDVTCGSGKAAAASGTCYSSGAYSKYTDIATAGAALTPINPSTESTLTALTAPVTLYIFFQIG